MSKRSPRRVVDDPTAALLGIAVRQAKQRPVPREQLSRACAVSEAPWTAEMPAAWENEFRRAYADELVTRGIAAEAQPSGKQSGSSGSGAPIRSIRVPDEEWDACQRAARADGVTVSVWLRRVASRASGYVLRSATGQGDA